MEKFRKDKVELLKALRILVKENIGYADVSDSLESEIAEHLMELKDRRRHRRLKHLGKALDDLIKETVSEEKLKKEERLFNEAKLKQTNEAYAAHCDSSQ